MFTDHDIKWIGLYQPNTFYLQSEYFSDKHVDKIFDQGASELYMGLADKVINHLDLDIKSQHLDLASFHVDGSYEDDVYNWLKDIAEIIVQN